MAPPTATVTAPSYPKLATVAVLRSKVFILNRHNPRYKSSVVTLSSSLQANPMLSSNSGSQGFLSSTGARCKALSALSSPFLGEDDDDLWRKTNVLPLRSRSLSLPRAYKDDVFKFRYPVITEKPEWWLRTLACVPYLIALQISDAGYFLHPFLEHYEMFENLIYFVPGAIKRLPPWFSMIYCYFGYIGIVKNKDWSHYIRFHLMMGMLLETALQLIWYTSNFLPLIHYNGCFGMHYWAGIGFGYILVLFECVRCALGGSLKIVPGAINRLPPWFSRIYCYFGYAGIVKNKALSRYIRIHLMMGMLLETAFKLIWYTGTFLPLTHFNGNFMMHFWAGIGIGYIFVLLACVRCALGGKYAHIPVISNAAYIHTRFNVGGFQRPF